MKTKDIVGTLVEAQPVRGATPSLKPQIRRLINQILGFEGGFEMLDDACIRYEGNRDDQRFFGEYEEGVRFAKKFPQMFAVSTEGGRWWFTGPPENTLAELRKIVAEETAESPAPEFPVRGRTSAVSQLNQQQKRQAPGRAGTPE